VVLRFYYFHNCPLLRVSSQAIRETFLSIDFALGDKSPRLPIGVPTR